MTTRSTLPVSCETRFVGDLQSGSSQAYRALIKREGDYIHGVCLGMLGCIRDAEDVSQQVFIKVFQNIDRFEHRAKLRTWMHRIALNLCKNRLSQRRRRPVWGALSLENTSEKRWSDRYAHQRRCPELCYGYTELGRRLDHALSLIEPSHADLIRRWAIDGASYADMAQTFAISIGTVKSRLHRARQALRSTLQEI